MTHMSIMPEGELLKSAIKWISEERQDSPDKHTSQLIDEASVKFDLSPNDAEFLARLIRDGEEILASEG